MEGDDAVHRSIRCRRQLCTDSWRLNGQPGIVVVVENLQLVNKMVTSFD